MSISFISVMEKIIRLKHLIQLQSAIIDQISARSKYTGNRYYFENDRKNSKEMLWQD
jgi:hypothetical protein